jgi:hypothetical protein
MKVVIDPHPKKSNHLKVVISETGQLEMVQIYHDGKGSAKAMLPVYEILKEEISRFGLKTRKLVESKPGLKS